MAFPTAFQRNAFQDDAFQMEAASVNVVAEPAGSAIAAGTFSKGQWHTLKTTIAARRKQEDDDKRAKERTAEDRRQREIARIAAEIAARRHGEDQTLAVQLAAIPPAAPANGQAMAQLQRIAQQAAHGVHMARQQRQTREAAEEDE